MKPSRRSILVGAAALGLPSSGYAAIGRGVAVSGTGGGAVQLATLTLVNTSGSTQASGFVSPIFGWAFKKGDVPSGTAPQFQISGVTQPYSWGCQAYWPDNSLRFAAFMLRCTASLTGSASQAIGVFNGGSAPAASARTLTEVYAQSLKVVLVGAGANFGLTGTWNAYLANDANNHLQGVYLDGQAGTVWRIDTELAQTPGGAAHGQLYCHHYIAALQDGSGNLGGFRHLGKLCQPWYNNDTPAKNWRACSSISVQFGAGPSTISGAPAWPFGAAAFTWTSGSTFHATAAHGFYQGAAASGGGANGINLVPGFLTTTGTLPTGLNTTTLYWALGTGGVANNFHLATDSQGLTLKSATGAGTGTHTFNPAPTVLHFGAVFTADVNAKWSFFQGTGSVASDNTVRTQADTTYLHNTGVIPPYDTTQSIPDNAAFSFNWNPFSVGPTGGVGVRGTGGPSPDIGPITAFSARHFYHQSANSELITRIIGHCAWMDGNQIFKDVTTRQYPNLTNSAYTGFPAASGTQQGLYKLAAATDGAWTAPPASGFVFVQNEIDMAHAPNWAYFAYLLYGEPQFLDLLNDQLNGSLLGFWPPSPLRNPTYPSTAYAILGNGGEAGADTDCRISAWANRNAQHAAMLAPSTHPDGTQLSKYVTDIADNSANWPYTVLTTAENSYCNTNGLWIGMTSANVGNAVSSGFQKNYFIMAMCIAAVRGNANALSWLNQTAVWIEHVRANLGGVWNLMNEYEHPVQAPTDINGHFAGALISSDANWATSEVSSGAPGAVGTLTWTTSTGLGTQGFTLSYAGGALLVADPANGDKIIFGNDLTIPNGFAAETAYYMRNFQRSGSSYKFDLTTTAGPSGGVLITPTLGGSINFPSSGQGISSPWFLRVTIPAASGGLHPDGNTNSTSYLCYCEAVWNWLVASGVTSGNLSAALSDANTRIANGVSPGVPIDYTVAGATDLWCYQNSF